MKQTSRKMSSPLRHYSLWLMPEESLGRSLQATIKTLSGRFHAPLFRPHLTLLGKIDAIPSVAAQKAEQMANKLSAFSLKPHKIAHSSAYFRCLFIDITPNQRLLSAHKQACRLFGIRINRYRPHVSLLYGNFSLARRRLLAKETTTPPSPMRMRYLALVNMGKNNQPSHWKTYRKYRLTYV